MWPFKEKNQNKPGETLVIKINGMHCSSCALTIDETLEELPGVYDSRSSYAKGEVSVRFEPNEVKVSQLHKEIEKLGYTTI
jgi:copper chaperone CopZ